MTHRIALPTAEKDARLWQRIARWYDQHLRSHHCPECGEPWADCGCVTEWR